MWTFNTHGCPCVGRSLQDKNARNILHMATFRSVVPESLWGGSPRHPLNLQVSKITMTHAEHLSVVLQYVLHSSHSSQILFPSITTT